MQTLCSDLCIGYQSELGLSTRFPPCAIVADSSATAYLSDLLSTFPFSAFCRRWSHDCSTHQTQQVWKACFLIHRTCDLEFPPQSSARCSKSSLLQIQSENVPLQKASVLRTFTVRPTKVQGKADSVLYISCECSGCARVIVLTCCFIFTVLLSA